MMNLRRIVSLIEDAPIAGTQPAPTPSAKFYDVLADYQNFERTIDKQTEAAKKQLDDTLVKNIGKKKIVIRASKGAIGQIEKDYTVDVKDVSITYLKDEYLIVITGTDGKEYYVNTAFKIKVVGDSTPSDKPDDGQTQPQQNNPAKSEQPASNSTGHQSRPGQVGRIVSPQNMGIAGGGPNTLSR